MANRVDEWLEAIGQVSQMLRLQGNKAYAVASKYCEASSDYQTSPFIYQTPTWVFAKIKSGC